MEREGGGKFENGNGMNGELGTYISKTNILDELRVNIRFCDEGFEGLIDNEIERCVFQTAFATFCKGSTDGAGDDHIIRILLGAVVNVSYV